MWILLHNNDDQGKQAATRARNAGLRFIDVVLENGPKAAYKDILIAREQAGADFLGILYSGHGSKSGKKFMSTNNKELNTTNFAKLLGLANPLRIVFFSCYGGLIVENTLTEFQTVDQIQVEVDNVNYSANLKGCSVEGPIDAIIGASVQPDMRRLAEDPNFRPYKATGYTVVL
ncbi:MAG: hypothetical protein GQ564_08535 [Bacteroidales bacterium]|nr:hypothetical protein [Bacteroidales bacterium]